MDYASPLSTRPVALVACALALLLLSLGAAVLAHWRHAVSAAERALQARAAEKRREIAGLSKVSDFVRVSLLEREIIKLEKEAAAAAKARAAQAQTSDSAGLGAAARVLQPAALLLLAVLFWGQPLAEGLPAHALGPGVATLLAFPGLPRGSLGVLAWLGICYVVAARVTAAVSRALGFATGAEPEEAGLMGMLKSALR
jgi:hypothetical protein